MTAITARADRQRRGVSKTRTYPVLTAVTIPQGALVAITSAGYATNATDSASDLGVAGVAAETVTNAGASGAVSIKVDCGMDMLLTASSITQAMVGTLMFVVDNNTVDDAAGPTNDVPVGILVEFVSTTSGWVFIPGDMKWATHA